MWSIRTTRYYSAMKAIKVLMNATAWPYPDKIVPREIGQTQTDRYCTIPLTRGTWDKQIHTESRLGVTGGQGREVQGAIAWELLTVLGVTEKCWK